VNELDDETGNLNQHNNRLGKGGDNTDKHDKIRKRNKIGKLNRGRRKGAGHPSLPSLQAKETSKKVQALRKATGYFPTKGISEQVRAKRYWFNEED
jgi:hypothetical protein